MPRADYPLEPQRLSPEGRNFFFGYYDRYALSADGRYHLALNPGFRERPNTGRDGAPLGVLDLERDCEWKVLESSPAWNWQMGCCSQWLGPDPAKLLVCNVRDGARAYGRLLHVEDGPVRDLELPVYDAARDGSYAVGANFHRIHICRAGYGYPDLEDPCSGRPAPDDDGLWRVDLATGRAELIVSLADIAKVPSPPGLPVHPGFGSGDLPEGMHWVNNIMVSPGGTRILFLHRWIENGKWGSTRLLCCQADGSGLKLVNPGPRVSHCDWLDEDRVLSWCQWWSEQMHYYLMDLRGGGPEILGGELFDSDGHCSFLPGSDGRWLLTDGYPGEDQHRPLILFDRESNTRYDLGRFRSPKSEQQPGDIRCDLHPRWAPDGRRVSFDSIHEGYRGVYAVDLGELVVRGV